jgi:hypothetical protein
MLAKEALRIELAYYVLPVAGLSHVIMRFHIFLQHLRHPQVIH